MQSERIRRAKLGGPGVTVAMVAGALLVLALFVAGCSIGGDTTTTAAPTTVTSVESTTTEGPTTTVAPETTTTEAASTTTTEALSSAEILQPDGTIKAMGYIDKVWEADGRRYISIDYAEMLTGDEAKEAAVEDGVIAPGEDLDNDYYIVNANPQKREFTVSASATFAASTFGEGMDQSVTWDELRSFWTASPPSGGEHLHDMPWWIVRDGTEVLSIAEQYLP
jgi:hypothetical protein